MAKKTETLAHYPYEGGGAQISIGGSPRGGNRITPGKAKELIISEGIMPLSAVKTGGKERDATVQKRRRKESSREHVPSAYVHESGIEFR